MRKASKHRCSLRKKLIQVYSDDLLTNFNKYIDSGTKLGSLYYLTLLNNTMTNLSILEDGHKKAIAEQFTEILGQDAFRQYLPNYTLSTLTNYAIDSAGVLTKPNILDSFYEYITIYRPLMVGETKTSMDLFFNKNMEKNQEGGPKQPLPSSKQTIAKLLEFWKVNPGRYFTISYKSLTNIITVKNQKSGKELDLCLIDVHEDNMFSDLKSFIDKNKYDTIISVAKEPGIVNSDKGWNLQANSLKDLVSAMRTSNTTYESSKNNLVSVNQENVAKFISNICKNDRIVRNDGNSTVFLNNKLNFFLSLCSYFYTTGNQFNLHYLNCFTFSNFNTLLENYETKELDETFQAFNHLSSLKLIDLFSASSCNYIRHHKCEDKPSYSLKTDLASCQLYGDYFFNFYITAADDIKRISKFNTKGSDDKTLVLVTADEAVYYLRALMTRGGVFIDSSETSSDETRKAVARLFAIEDDIHSTSQSPMHQEVIDSINKLHAPGLDLKNPSKKELDNCDLLKYLKLTDL